MDAVRRAFRRLYQLSRLLANYVGMINDTTMTMGSLRSLQLHQGAIMKSISLLAEKYDITFCVVVSSILRQWRGYCLGKRDERRSHL